MSFMIASEHLIQKHSTPYLLIVEYMYMSNPNTLNLYDLNYS